jgi:hypothetical protein
MIASIHLRRFGLTDQTFTDKAFKGPPVGAIIASIVGVIGWLVFILLYALLWSKGFNLFQNIIVTVVSLAIAALLIGLMWVVWLFPRGKLRGWAT